MSMTTAMGKNFRVENITYKHARKQSEIENEGESEEEPGQDEKPNVALKHEKVMEVYKAKIANTSDSNEKRVYSQTITWIKDLLTTKKELLAIREKEIARGEEDKDIEEIED